MFKLIRIIVAAALFALLAVSGLAACGAPTVTGHPAPGAASQPTIASPPAPGVPTGGSPDDVRAPWRGQH
ncbi:MAG TPA: hypothetical protein VF916_01720 [Ktedonobacterales bacterium]